MKYVKNGRCLMPDGAFAQTDLAFDGDRITSVGAYLPQTGAETADASGCFVIPGLIDIHTHGAVGVDATVTDREGLSRLSTFYAAGGVTSFLPTTVTSDLETLYTAAGRIASAAKDGVPGASVEGAHIEGPYISPIQPGCQEVRMIRKPDISEFNRFRALLGDLTLRFTVAPELDHAAEFIRHARENGALVTIGHTDADYETSMRALRDGANCFTHLFNAMRGLHHRQAGTVGAALSSDAFAELICDGLHVCPEVVRLVCRLKGPDKLVLITDSMNATGLPDGEYEFAGSRITVSGGAARSPEGRLAGSTLRLFDGVKNLMKFTGASFAQAVCAATRNPAEAIGRAGDLGTLAPGKRADLVILDGELNILYTICKGNVVYRRDAAV